jgi:hypothetical protein
MHLWSQPTVDIHHAALSSLLRRLQLAPWVSIPSFPGFTSTSTVPNDWPTPPLKGPGAGDDDDCCLGPLRGACEGAQHDLTAILTLLILTSA